MTSWGEVRLSRFFVSARRLPGEPVQPERALCDGLRRRPASSGAGGPVSRGAPTAPHPRGGAHAVAEGAASAHGTARTRRLGGECQNRAPNSPRMSRSVWFLGLDSPAGAYGAPRLRRSEGVRSRPRKIRDRKTIQNARKLANSGCGLGTGAAGAPLRHDPPRGEQRRVVSATL